MENPLALALHSKRKRPAKLCLKPTKGQPAIAAWWWLALVTVMQFAENLTDRQAADAV